MRVHHIALGVRDLEISADFYKKMFGFQELTRFTKPGWKGSAIILELHDMQLELFHFDDMKVVSDQSSDLNVLGFRHIGIEVDNVDEKHKELISQGVDVDSPQKGTTCAAFCFLRDPNGVTIELYQRK